MTVGRGGPEHRTSQRIDVRLSAEVQSGPRHFTALTRNLSIGGLCLEAGVPVAEGEELVIGLFLVFDDVEDATREPLQMRGRVAWATPGDGGEPTIVGVRFESVSAVQMAGLTKFLKMVAE
jgi:hypothetical protein